MNKRRLLQESGGVENDGIPASSQEEGHEEDGDDGDPAEPDDESGKEAKDDFLGTSLFTETVKKQANLGVLLAPTLAPSVC